MLSKIRQMILAPAFAVAIFGLLGSSAAQAQVPPLCPGAWVDDFNTLDPTRWLVANEPAPGSSVTNLGFYDPNNVGVGDGLLTLTLTQTDTGVPNSDGNTVWESRGALIYTPDLCGYGTYEWTMRMGSSSINPLQPGNNVSGGVSGGLVFLNPSVTEIVFEHSAHSWQNGNGHSAPESIWFVNFHNVAPLEVVDEVEEQTFTEHPLADVYQSFHHYKFILKPDSITYCIDNRRITVHTDDVPSDPGHFMISYFGRNFALWGGTATPGTRSFYVDRAGYTPLGNPSVEACDLPVLTVTAENKSKTYGDADPAFTFSYSGFLGSDSASDIDTPPTCSVAVPHTNVGTYPITCSGGADNNYTFSYNGGTLTVNQAGVLTVTAENKSKTYGDADPAFTFSYSGFLGSDSASDIDTPPTCGVAVPHTEVGSYPITCSGGADNNYTFSYNSGTLTVNPKVITDGRMTGGGSILPDGDGGRNNLRITHGFELHCDPNDVPNNLEVDWNTSSARDSHQFRLDRLSTVSCTDNPSINQGPPSNSEFDTISGTGTGFYNGQPGSIITFVFTDAGQPGRNDTAYYRIEFPSGTVVLEAQGTLQNGNQQAH